MSDWTSFTDEEINSIKLKLNEKFDLCFKLMVFLSPLFCLIFIYAPSKKDGIRMIDRMSIHDAVIQSAILWFLVLIVIWFLNKYRIDGQVSDSRKFLRKKNIEATIKSCLLYTSDAPTKA